MKWVTSRKLRINRAATVWLIRRFIDPDAIFLFVEEDQVHATELSEGAVGFHAPGARYPKRDALGRVSFEGLVHEHCASDLALQRMARIVHDADAPSPGRVPEPEAAGLRMITVAFPTVASSDGEIVEKSAFVYDSLYAALAKK